MLTCSGLKRTQPRERRGGSFFRLEDLSTPFGGLSPPSVFTAAAAAGAASPSPDRDKSTSSPNESTLSFFVKGTGSLMMSSNNLRSPLKRDEGHHPKIGVDTEVSTVRLR